LMIVIKTQLGDDFRRFRVNEDVTFDSLCRLLGKSHNEEDFIECFLMKYVDSEGDAITITTTPELEEAFLQLQEQQIPILRLTLSRKPRARVSSVPRAPLTRLEIPKIRVPTEHIAPLLTPRIVEEPDPARTVEVPSPARTVEVPDPARTVEVPNPARAVEVPSLPTQFLPTVIHEITQFTPQKRHEPTPAKSNTYALECCNVGHLLWLADEVTSKCVSLSDDMSRNLTDICSKSIAMDMPLDSIYEACQQTSAQCALLSAQLSSECLTICSQSVAPDVASYSTKQMRNTCNLLAEETNFRCNQVSNQINDSMNPLHQEIMSLCKHTAESCRDSIFAVNNLYGEGMVAKLSIEQSALAAETNTLSMRVSDNLVATLMAI